MRISDWSSDVCSSDLYSLRIASLPCRCTRRLLRRAICVFDLPLQAGDGLGACPQVARERWITRGRAQSRHGGCTKTLKQPAWPDQRSEEHTSELQSLMRISYAGLCLKKKKPDE